MGFLSPILLSLVALCIVPSADSLRLLYANRKDIRIVRTSHKEPNETVVVAGLENAHAVDFCFAEGFVFWTDVSLEKIKRIRVTGDTRKVEDVISVGLKKPEGLAVDWIAKKLYWTDCRDSDWERNRIEVANLDGTNRKVLFWRNLGLPRAIAVDPLKGFMFWTDWGEKAKIERAEMDGSNRGIIISQDIHWPNGLTIDYNAEKIYWTDAKLFYIAKANYDGSNRQRIFRTPMPSQCVLGHPFALTLYENKIYWTDWKTRGIHSTNKNSGTRCQVVGSKGLSPMDIHAFKPRRQLPRPGQNPCNSTSNGECSHLCLLNTEGHSCACPTGVRLLSDGKTCQRGPVHFLLLARKEDLRRISLDTPDLTDVVVPVSGIRHAVAIDFDPVDKFVYWSDDENLEIKRCRMNGQDAEVIVSSDHHHPDGLAVDWVARNLYWTDTGTDRIEVSRLNGSSRNVLISENLDEPRAIALDPTRGYMYWTDWGKHPKIERAALDGSHRIILVQTSVTWPNGLTIDYLSRKIYWADAKLDKIEVMNLDGSNRRVVLSDKLPHIFGFTVLGNRLYWTDWQRKAIESVNKRTGKDRKNIISSLPDLMGLKAVNLNLAYAYGSNDCQHNNGNCSHLCLFRSSGVKCGCPNGMELLADKKNCISPKKCLQDEFACSSGACLKKNWHCDGRDDCIDGSDEKNCKPAAVDGRYTPWGKWGACSTTCNPGVRIKTRTCTNPPPRHGGKNCRVFGPPKKLRRCNKKPHQRCTSPRLFMLYSTKKDIRRILLNSSDNLDVVLPVRSLSDIRAIDYDINSHLVYWIDGTTKTIRCAFQSGTNVKIIKLDAGAVPYDLAIDSFGQQLYWTDTASNSIKVYSLKNKIHLGIVFREKDVYPRSIVLHPEKGLMYFTNDNPVKKYILRVSMGGSDRLMLFRSKSPGDLAIDKQGRKLYWTDTELKKIEYGDLAGTNRTTLVEFNVLHPVGIVVFGDYVYWIDRETRSLYKIKKGGEVYGVAVQATVDDLSDMIVVDARKSTVDHPCARNRCSHICLVGSHGQAQCSCPVDNILNEDNTTCGAPKKCLQDEFACSSGACLKKNWHCDGRDDCIDGSDEKNCTPCKDGEHRCSGGKCISVKKLCDKTADCDDASDEDPENCPVKCLENEFECLDNQVVIDCIPLDWKCDKSKDCADNSDEMDCDLPTGNSTARGPAGAFHPSNLSGKMVGVIVASIIVCVIFLTIAVLICRRLKHGPDCNVTHDI